VRHLFAILITVTCLLTGTAAAAQTVVGMVRAVYDGDTILLATQRQSRLKIRLYGVDAPETGKGGQPGQRFAGVARRTLMYKLMGRQVSAEIRETDQYNRAVAVIRYQGRDINAEMIAEGMAWAYRRYLQAPYASEYLAAENTARNRRQGLWRDPKPVPPWEFRLGGRKGRGRR